MFAYMPLVCVCVWNSTIPHCSSAATFNRATFLHQSNQMRTRKEGEREGREGNGRKEREAQQGMKEGSQKTRSVSGGGDVGHVC